MTRTKKRFELAVTMAFPLLLAIGCASTGKPSSTVSKGESWQCRNDLEIRCGDGACEAETGDGFTPMSVSVDNSGVMSVCAYSGCWEGTGEVVRSRNFLVFTGHDLEFSTSPGPEAMASVVIALDRTDGVATLKVGDFAHPLLCEGGPVEP